MYILYIAKNKKAILDLHKIYKKIFKKLKI